MYDVRAHKYLGRLAHLDYSMSESSGELLAIMPRRIGRIMLTAPRQVERGRPAPISVAVEDWKADMGKAVFRLEVCDPNGKLNASYARNVVCDAGHAETAIPFALNDASGQWRVRAFEVCSGQREEARIRVVGE